MRAFGTFTITVNPDAQVDSVADQVLCVGELTNDILFTTTNTDGTTTYAWTDNPAIGLAASGTEIFIFCCCWFFFRF